VHRTDDGGNGVINSLHYHGYNMTYKIYGAIIIAFIWGFAILTLVPQLISASSYIANAIGLIILFAAPIATYGIISNLLGPAVHNSHKDKR
jgi:hypothetical protein